jgi:hypothetical protein
MERHAARTLALALTLSAGTTGALAQVPCAVYDAGLGSLPEDQGWVVTNVQGTATVVPPGELVLSTLPFTATACETSSDPSLLSWRLPAPAFDFDQGAVFEAEVRIEASQDAQNPCTGWPRPGFLMALRDSSLRNAYLGLLEDRLVLFNDPYTTVGGPGYFEVPFDTTDGYHRYRIDVDALGVDVRVDGVLRLSAPHGGTAGTAAAVVVGDGTTWANSQARVRGFRFRAGPGPECDRAWSGASPARRATVRRP